MTDEDDYYPTYDLKFVTGDYYRRQILTEDPDPDSPDPSNPVMIPRNFTGWSARAQIRKNTKRDTPITAVIQVSLGLVDPTDGYIVIELLEEESIKCVERGGWDLELIDPSGKPDTVMGGKSLPKLDYTHD